MNMKAALLCEPKRVEISEIAAIVHSVGAVAVTLIPIKRAPVSQFQDALQKSLWLLLNLLAGRYTMEYSMKMR
jgi:hypothetical protein